MIRNQPFIIDALLIYGLCAITVAQPIYDALGNGATFFVAHDAGKLEILVFAMIISVGLPTILVIAEAIVGLLSSPVRHIFHYSLVFLLAWAFALAALNNFSDANPVFILVCSGFLGLPFTVLVWKLDSVRNISAIVSFGVIVFPALFLFMTPVSKIVLAGNDAGVEGQVPTNMTTPVVLVIFDEFSPLGLLDSENNIDSVRFPNFAALAQTSTWYPNTVSVHFRTRYVIPAILTGNLPPRENEDLLPTQTSYPDNIFSLLGGNYEFNAIEPISKLCPKKYCNSILATSSFGWGVFWSDIVVIYKHIFYPKIWARMWLPELSDGWHNFANLTSPNTALLKQRNDKEAKIAGNFLTSHKVKKLQGRARIFDEFKNNIQPNSSTFDFLHSVLPHSPWIYLPDGRHYKERQMKRGGFWQDQPKADEVYHRYLMQLGYVDKNIGKLIHHLKRIGKFDKAIIIVMADHGLNFQAGLKRRDIKDNPSTLHVPLFVKYPKQDKGVIDERFSYTIDILPTIADVLEIELPWNVDGQSLLAEVPRKNSTLNIWDAGKEYTLFQDEIINLNAIPDRIEKFGERTPLENLSIKHSHTTLIGQSSAELDEILIESELKPKLKFDLKDYANISLSDDYLPAMFYGDIELAVEHEGPLSIAVTLNGKVVADIPTSGKGKMRHFALLLPPAAFVEGENELEAFLIAFSPTKKPIVTKIQLDTTRSNTSEKFGS